MGVPCPILYIVAGVQVRLPVGFPVLTRFSRYQSRVFDVGEVSGEIPVIEDADHLVVLNGVAKSMGAISGRPKGPYTVKNRNPIVCIP